MTEWNTLIPFFCGRPGTRTLKAISLLVFKTSSSSSRMPSFGFSRCQWTSLLNYLIIFQLGKYTNIYLYIQASNMTLILLNTRASNRIRTDDNSLTRRALYQLSYGGKCLNGRTRTFNNPHSKWGNHTNGSHLDFILKNFLPFQLAKYTKNIPGNQIFLKKKPGFFRAGFNFGFCIF